MSDNIKNRLKDLFPKRQPRKEITLTLQHEQDILDMVESSMIHGRCATCGTQYPRTWPEFMIQKVQHDWQNFTQDSGDMKGLFLLLCPDCGSSEKHIQLSFNYIEKLKRMELPPGNILCFTMSGLHRDDCPPQLLEEAEKQIRRKADEQDARPLVRFSEDLPPGLERSMASLISRFLGNIAKRSIRERACAGCGMKADQRPFSQQGFYMPYTFSEGKQVPLLICGDCRHHLSGDKQYAFISPS